MRENGGERARAFDGAYRRAKIVVSAHIALDFPGIGSIAVHVDGPFWVAARLAPSAGLVAVPASRLARCGSRGRRQWPSSKPASKQRAPRRSIAAGRTIRLAKASAHPDGVARWHAQDRQRR